MNYNLFLWYFSQQTKYNSYVFIVGAFSSSQIILVVTSAFQVFVVIVLPSFTIITVSGFFSIVKIDPLKCKNSPIKYTALPYRNKTVQHHISDKVPCNKIYPWEYRAPLLFAEIEWFCQKWWGFRPSYIIIKSFLLNLSKCAGKLCRP